MQKLIIVLLAILTLGCTPSTQPLQSAKTMKQELTLSGTKVTISAISNHKISYGDFQLSNSGKQTLNVAILSAELRIGDKSQVLQPLHLIFENGFGSIPIEGFEIQGKTTIKFMISFPSVDANAYFGDAVAVRLTIRVGSETLVADSHIVLERRIPRR